MNVVTPAYLAGNVNKAATVLHSTRKSHVSPSPVSWPAAVILKNGSKRRRRVIIYTRTVVDHLEPLETRAASVETILLLKAWRWLT